ncbi:MAG: hypothetical protein J6Y37_14985 [Paludibacteraceae bacterium]|nr:hypothetical protein [Paludibacteraceae bacterium]
MATKYLKNSDKILQVVLNDAKLIEIGKYKPQEIGTLDDALFSDNAVIRTVALMVSGLSQKLSDNQIYNQVFNYLKGESL